MQATAEWLDTNYYDVLGVATDATAKQIKSAYRKLARTAHPDANPDDPTAEERFSDIAKAYEVLSDDDQRAEYDDLRSRPQRQSFGHGDHGFGYQSGSAQNFDTADFDMADLFDLFGGGAPGGARRGADWPIQGRDISATLQLDFEDAVNGLTTTLEVDGRQVKTRIPAGVSDQQTIRLAGKGSTGISGGPNGDLLLKVLVNEHAQFGRSGSNLTVEVPISYTDAVLGGEMHVPMLDGTTVTIKVPAGTQPGTRFRVAGRGVPHAKKPGHMLASVTIAVPTSVSDEDAELLRQLSGTTGHESP